MLVLDGAPKLDPSGADALLGCLMQVEARDADSQDEGIRPPGTGV